VWGLIYDFALRDSMRLCFVEVLRAVQMSEGNGDDSLIYLLQG